MQHRVIVIPADSDLPIEVKQYDDSNLNNMYDLIGLDHDETVGVVGLGDGQHQLLHDDNGRLKAGPVLNIRAMLLMGAMRGVDPNLLSPLVGNMAVLGYDPLGETTDVTPELVSYTETIEKELNS